MLLISAGSLGGAFDFDGHLRSTLLACGELGDQPFAGSCLARWIKMDFECDISKLVCEKVTCSLPIADPTQCYYQSYILTYLGRLIQQMS